MSHLPREELVRALQARTNVLEGNLDALSFQRAAIKDGATGAEGEIPEHVREIMDFLAARTRAELEWTQPLPAPAARRRVPLHGRGRVPGSRTWRRLVR